MPPTGGSQRWLIHHATVADVDGVLSMSSGASSGGGLLTLLFERASRLLSRKLSRISKEQAVLLERLAEVAQLVGTELLAATSLDDLDARIDAAIERRDIAARLNAVAATAAQVDDSTAQTSKLAPGDLDLTHVLGEGQAPLLREAERLLGAVHDAYVGIRRIADQLALAGVSVSLPERPVNEEDPLAFLSDPEIPPAVSSAMLGAAVATVSLLAIYHAQQIGERLEPWLAHTITQRFVVGLRKQVTLLASLPIVSIDPEVVPLSERIDIAKLEEEHREANLAMAQFLRDAEESGQDVYAPEPRK